MRHLSVAIGCALLVCLLAFSTTAWAAWHVADEARNIVSTPALAGVIVEDDARVVDLRPGADITKDIHVKNTGAFDAFARVRVDTYWADGQGARMALPTHDIEVAYNTSMWKAGADGFFYYRGVLSPGQTTDSLIKSIKLSPSLTCKDTAREAHVDGYLDCIQTTASAVEAAWGKDYAFMESTKPVHPQENATAVTFVSPDAGFAFEPASTDLFANFKQLTPGESRTQMLLVKNIHSEPVTLAISTKDVEQPGLTPIERARVLDFLNSYVTMKISDSANKVLYDGPVLNTAAMRFNMPLSSGATTVWKVDLVVDPAAHNGHQDIPLGQLTWALEASAADPSKQPPSGGTTASGSGGLGAVVDNMPKTGDFPWLVLGVLASVVSGATLIALLLARKRDREREERVYHVG
ncbi:MAG: hypothetical protein RR323_06465 [Raoultibacter sp.]